MQQPLFVRILFNALYGSESSILCTQKKRYADAALEFQKLYPNRTEIHIYSAPGRTEIGGNHTDHQHGCILAAAVDLDVIAIVGFHNEKVIRVKSAGYPADFVDLSDLSVHSDEAGSAAMIRGIAAKFTERRWFCRYHSGVCAVGTDGCILQCNESAVWCG